MMRILLPAAALVLFGCQRGSEASSEAAAKDARRTARDLRPAAMTPGDQGNTEQDREITRQIRQALELNDAAAPAAHGVTIDTADGRVTLRGRVGSSAERDEIVSQAQRARGVLQVDDQLEISGL